MNYFLKLLLILNFILAANTFAEGIEIVANPAFNSAESSEKVEVVAKNNDNAIALRIKKIMKTTGWYTNADVEVKEGIVFLKGQTTKKEYKAWAETLAKKTQDVIAVVNNIQVKNPDVLNPNQWTSSLQKLTKQFIQDAPIYVIALVVLLLTWGFNYVVEILFRKSFFYKKIHPLLAEIIVIAGKLIIFLVGIYIILQIMGWTTIALTIAGGTGLLGIILGMAFKDITENLLSSVLLSIQKPFKNGDLIKVGDIKGYVERLTLRATILLTEDGKQVQIPNSIIYKTIIHNYSISTKQREDFSITIPYDRSVAETQASILKILKETSAVLSDPEPLVLVDKLYINRVKLNIYFWLNGSKYNSSKVKSSIIRLTKAIVYNKEEHTEDELKKIATESKENPYQKAKKLEEMNESNVGAENLLNSK